MLGHRGEESSGGFGGSTGFSTAWKKSFHTVENPGVIFPRRGKRVKTGKQAENEKTGGVIFEIYEMIFEVETSGMSGIGWARIIAGFHGAKEKPWLKNCNT
jgi:hypothetical protein